MTVHEAPVGATVEWYTPADLFARLDPFRSPRLFDLDPAGTDSPFAHVPAKTVWTRSDNGLGREWFGHVWLNPPYGPSGIKFIDRMNEHRDGLLLLPSRTETAAYQRALAWSDGVCLLRDRLWFVRHDGATGRAAFGSTLFAYGKWAVGLLHRADLGWMP